VRLVLPIIEQTTNLGRSHVIESSLYLHFSGVAPRHILSHFVERDPQLALIVVLAGANHDVLGLQLVLSVATSLLSSIAFDQIES
jgi:hypothetical protein